jgi:hypothetical protein
MTKLNELIEVISLYEHVKESGLSRLGIETDRRAFICGTESYNRIKELFTDSKDYSTLELKDGDALLIGRLGYNFEDDSEIEPTLFLSELEDEKFELYDKMDGKSMEIIKTIMNIPELKDGLITGYGVPELSSIIFDCVSSFYDTEA